MDNSIIDQILEKASQLRGPPAYGTIFAVLLACGLGLPVPEDVTLVTAGYLSHLGNIELSVAIGICLIGVLLGDLFLFFLGRKLGKRAFKLPLIRNLLTPDRIKYAEERLQKNSRKVMFAARFLAGLRAPIYLTAGILNVRPRIFVGLDFLAATLSVPLLVTAGWYFGAEIDIALLYVRKAEKYVMIGLAVIGAYFIIRSLLRPSDPKMDEEE